MTSLQTTVICNIGSVVLGVIACTLACFAISRKQAHRYSVASFSFCALSLLLQFFEIGNRANSGDFAAMPIRSGRLFWLLLFWLALPLP